MAKIAFGSCFHNFNEKVPGALAIDGSTAFFAMGDLAYGNAVPPQSFTLHNITETEGEDWTTENFTKFLEYYSSSKAVQKIKQNMLFYYMPDDHEYSGDNWDGSITQAEGGLSGMVDATQAEVDQSFLNSSTAFWAFDKDNPTNNDSEAIAQACPEADAPDSNYVPKYFRVTHGDAEYFAIDCISHRDKHGTAEPALPDQKTHLGTNQLAWLFARLKASTATYKVIVSGKETFAASVANGDTWAAYGAGGGYERERDEILDYIEAATDWAVPGGVLWVAGDRHTPQICLTYVDAHDEPPDAGGSDWDHVCFVACPFGVEGNDVPGVAANEVKILRSDWGQVVVTGEDKGDYYEIIYYNSSNGRRLFTARVNAGENKMSYPPQQMSI